MSLLGTICQLLLRAPWSLRAGAQPGSLIPIQEQGSVTVGSRNQRASTAPAAVWNGISTAALFTHLVGTAGDRNGREKASWRASARGCAREPAPQENCVGSFGVGDTGAHPPPPSDCRELEAVAEVSGRGNSRGQRCQ